MGLDVHVGSLTRSYVEGRPTWSSGSPTTRAWPSTASPPRGHRLGRAALARGLSRWLGDRLDAALDWDESGPAPCFTDKPGWDGYGGTLLWPPTMSTPSCRRRPRCRPPDPSADGHSLSAAGGGLAVLLRLAERSVACRVPMKLDF